MIVLFNNRHIHAMSSFSGTQGPNQLSLNRVSEVHPNQHYFEQTLGSTDYQYNTQPIQNNSCGCLNRTSYPQLKQQPQPWNISYQDQSPQTMCPYVVNIETQPGDGGMFSFCATQE